MGIVYPYGSVEVVVPATELIEIIAREGEARVYYMRGDFNTEKSRQLQVTLNNEKDTLTPSASEDITVRIEAGAGKVYYDYGTAPAAEDKHVDVLYQTKTVATVADAGTITVAQIRNGILWQDASGGNVTMTTPTASQLSAAFPDLSSGEGIYLHLASNHASNTSTIAGGTGVTLTSGSSAAVTATGGTMFLRRSNSSAWTLTRIG